MTKYKEPPDKYEFEKGARFVLGKSGKRPFIVFGINPSTADNRTPDRTIRRIISIGKKEQCDGWVMLNMYPQRNRDPAKLHSSLHELLNKKNLEWISDVMESFPDGVLCAAWGNNIQRRPYLKYCLRDICNLKGMVSRSWKRIGPTTKTGHPRHPSRLPHTAKLENFDMREYRQALDILDI